jgi:hypothetical protein
MTADFDCSRSGSFRTVFGARLRFLFAMECGLQLPWRKHYSVLDFLTSSALLAIYPRRVLCHHKLPRTGLGSWGVFALAFKKSGKRLRGAGMNCRPSYERCEGENEKVSGG